MSVARRHGLYGIEIGSGNLLGGITSQRVSTGTELQSDPVSGEQYARFQAITGQRPGAAWTTRAVAAALDLVGLTGTSIAGLTGGLKLYAQKRANEASRAAGATHRSYTFNAGLIVPDRLTAGHQADAMINYMAAATYDGSNDPVVIGDTVSLPAGLVDDERFTLGPIALEGTTYSHVRSLEIGFGISAQPDGSDSEIWDRFISIDSIQPELMISGIDIEWLKAANIPLTGRAIAHATTSIYLRKRQQGGTYVADGTAEHIKLTAAGLAIIEGAFEASDLAAGECNLRMPLRYDGTNAPLVINTASAIT